MTLGILSLQWLWQLFALFQDLLVEACVYVLTSFSHSLICLESQKTDSLCIEAQTFQDKLAGRSPQGKGEWAGRDSRRWRIPTGCLCTGPALTTPDPRDPSTDNKLAARGSWLHVGCRIGSHLGTTVSWEIRFDGGKLWKVGSGGDKEVILEVNATSQPSWAEGEW